MSKLQELQNRIGYTFEKEGLLRQALTHSSYANEKHMKKHSDNERLEFLGDAVLEIVSSDFLYRNYPDLPEGDLTSLHWHFVPERWILAIICCLARVKTRQVEENVNQFYRML